MAAYQEKHWDAPPTHTFDEMMLAYLAETTDKRSHVRDLDAARHLYKVFNGMELLAITATEVRQYVQERRAVIAPATANRELCLLSVAFNHARHHWDWVITNPHCPASPWVFSHADGSRLRDVKKSFHSACRRAGIDDFRIHDLRHTCAAWLVSAGVALPEVRDLLGHASIKMTERHAHLAPENVRAAVAVLESASRSGHVDAARKAEQRR